MEIDKIIHRLETIKQQMIDAYEQGKVINVVQKEWKHREVHEFSSQEEIVGETIVFEIGETRRTKFT